MPARVFLNPRCHGGRGLAAWKGVAGELQRRLEGFRVEEIGPPEDLATRVSAAVEEGDRLLIAVGGDGTVNLLLNAVLACRNAEGVVLGAVGLGSSNDFHKPFRKESSIHGIPVKVDWAHAVARDVIRVEYQVGSQPPEIRHCLINASIGITAQGNLIFNGGSVFLRALQRVSVNAAILAAALKSIIGYHDFPCRLSVDDGGAATFHVSNLGVIKSRHFAGGLRYDTDLEPAAGKIGINLYAGLSLPEKLLSLIGFRQGLFRRRRKAKCWLGQRLSVESGRLFPLEMDGEVVQAGAARFQVLPGAVRCCP
jgi:diacylglycerol kinase family enzyme